MAPHFKGKGICEQTENDGMLKIKKKIWYMSKKMAVVKNQSVYKFSYVFFTILTKCQLIHTSLLRMKIVISYELDK